MPGMLAITTYVRIGDRTEISAPPFAIRMPLQGNRVMQALDVFRPFAGILVALAQAFAVPRRPADAAWGAALLDDRQRADVGLGPGEFEPRPRRGGAPAPAGRVALPERSGFGI